MDLKKNLLLAREQNAFASRQLCTDEESEQYRKLLADNKPLPAGVFFYALENYFYSIPDLQDISHEEMIELTLQEQLSAIKTIKKCVVYFTTISIISLVLGAIAALVFALNM